MSKAQLEKFISLISPAAVLKEAGKTPNFFANLAKDGRELGYIFSEEEVAEWVAEHAKPRRNGELSDAQLEAVSGGRGRVGPRRKFG